MGMFSTSKRVKEVASATALISGTKNEREIYVKEVLMEGIASKAADMGSYLTDSLSNSGPHIPFKRLAALSKGPNSRFAKTTGIMDAALDITKTKAGFSLKSLITEVTGSEVTNTDTYTIGLEDVYWVVAKYVADNHRLHAVHDLWTFYIADDPEQPIYGPPQAGKSPVALKLIEVPEVNDDGSFVTEPNEEVYEEFLVYVNRLSPGTYLYAEYNMVGPEVLVSSTVDTVGREEDTIAAKIAADYAVISDNSYPNEYQKAVQDIIHKKHVDVDDNVTWEYSETLNYTVPEQVTDRDVVLFYRQPHSLVAATEYTVRHEREHVVVGTVATEHHPDSDTIIYRTTEVLGPKTMEYTDEDYFVVPVHEIPKVLITPFSSVAHHFDVETTKTTAMPIVPLRREKTWIYETYPKNSPARRHINFCVKRLLNQTLDDFSKGLNDNFEDGGSLSKIDYASIFFGVPLNIEDPYADTYMFEFFKSTAQPPSVLQSIKDRLVIYNQQVEEIAAVLARVEFVGGGMTYGFRDPVTGKLYSRRKLPEPDAFPLLETKTSITLNNSNETFKFKRRMEWLSFVEVVEGTPPQRNRLKTHKTEVATTLYRKYINFGMQTGGEGIRLIPAIEDQFTLTRAISGNKYEVVTVLGLKTTTYEKWDKTTTQGSKASFKKSTNEDENVGEGECVNIIPIVPEILKRCPAVVQAQTGYCATTLVLSVAYTWKKKTGFGSFVSSLGAAFKFSFKALGSLFIGDIKGFGKNAWYTVKETAMAFTQIVGIAMKNVEKALVALGVDASHAGFIVKAVILVVSIIAAIPTGGASLSWPTLIASMAISVASEVSAHVIASKMRKLERQRQEFIEEYTDIVGALKESEDSLTLMLKNFDHSKFFDIGHSASSVGTDPILEIERLSDTIGMLGTGPWVNWSTDKAINNHKYQFDLMNFKSLEINLVDYDNNQAAMSGE